MTLMVDEGIHAIFDAIPPEDRNPGVHLMTGPIYVDGARPGDVLEPTRTSIRRCATPAWRCCACSASTVA